MPVPEYYNNIKDPGLASEIRKFGENLDTRGELFMSRNTFLRWKIHLDYGLTLADFNNLAGGIWRYRIIPNARDRMESQAYIQDGYYFDRVGLDAAFTLFYYCRTDKFFLENLRKRDGDPMKLMDLWREKVDWARTGLGESPLKDLLNYPQTPIKKDLIVRPASSEEELNGKIPPIPFDPSHLEIRAPFLLAPNQPFTEQPPFDYALKTAAEFASVSRKRLDEALIAGDIEQSSKHRLLRQIAEYLDNFPSWKEYVETQCELGIYRRDGTVWNVSDTARIDNRGVTGELKLTNPQVTVLSNSHPRINMADSYAFWVSKMLLKKQRLNPATSPVTYIGRIDTFLIKLNRGKYDGKVFTFSLQESTRLKS